MTENMTSQFSEVQSNEKLAALPDSSAALSAFIERRLPSGKHPLAASARHHFKRTGKQLRGRMALAAGDSFGVPRTASLPWASAVEILHNASLVHDDICDGDMVRRGTPSVWALYGRDTALSLGDWLIALSFELAAEAAYHGQTPQLVSILSRHMAATTTGQALEFEVRAYPDWAGYMEISTGKTAPLFIASVEGIAHLASRRDAIQPLNRFFSAAGGCYQIANDMLNVIGKDGAESPASDLLRRAPNAVIVMFQTTLDKHMAKAFNSWLSSGDTHDAHAWQERLRRSPALTMTSSALLSMLEEAEASSAVFPPDCRVIITPILTQLRHVCGDLMSLQV